MPAPDAVKIDVQGYEHEVLQGFGGLLQGCLGIELETHVYPVYQDQKLLGDLIALLEPYGFVLRRLSPVPSFDGDVVELDAWFTQEHRSLAAAGRGGARQVPHDLRRLGPHRLQPHRPRLDPSSALRAVAARAKPDQAAAMPPSAPYAVLFKVHFWDAFAERQFRRLAARAGRGRPVRRGRRDQRRG